MSRKSFFLGIGIALVLVSGVGAGLSLLVRHEPTFYQRCDVPPGEQRQKASTTFYAECLRLGEGILNKRQWFATFTAEQINSYFAEDYLCLPLEARMLPETIHEPRIAIEPDKIRLAFRYGTERWNTVVSIDLRVWLAPREPNVVALELQGLHAGSLPISAQSLLEGISETARQQNIQVTWYRHNGNPVALLRFQPYSSRPTFQLQRLELHQGMIVIAGRSIDPTPATAVSANLPSLGAE